MLEEYTCDRCRHKWVPRNDETHRACPKCKGTYWGVSKRLNSKKEMAEKLAGIK